MGRRSGLYGFVSAIQREARRAAAAKARQEREAIRLQRQYDRLSERAEILDNKLKKELYIQDRIKEVEDLNNNLDVSLDRLRSLFKIGLENSGPIDFNNLKMKLELPEFDIGNLDSSPNQPPELSSFLPKHPGKFKNFFKSTRIKYQEELAEGKNKFEKASEEYLENEKERLLYLEEAKNNHQKKIDQIIKKTEDFNHQVEQFEVDVKRRNTNALIHYFTLVLDQNDYPEDFPRNHKIAFIEESKLLVVEIDFPTVEVIPSIASYKYIKKDDKIKETNRPVNQIRELYRYVISSISLRTIHEIFCSDKYEVIESIILNGHVKTINKATGKFIRPCLVTLRVSRDLFSSLDLRNVEPDACLKTLNASISKSPAELVPVRPVIEFNMVDNRFIEEMDVLSTLDTRPNLMELSPKEFESLITNLFEKMGLETRQTVPSRDGGVDCVAFDSRPIFGGKVVIQAKRYKNTVGVSAVRDLFGTMQNEGASKGILVTTSGYGKASFEFAEGKPIELLSGSNLLYLLSEHAGIEAKIIPPEDWKDPELD